MPTTLDHCILPSLIPAASLPWAHPAVESFTPQALALASQRWARLPDNQTADGIEQPSQMSSEQSQRLLAPEGWRRIPESEKAGKS